MMVCTLHCVGFNQCCCMLRAARFKDHARYKVRCGAIARLCMMRWGCPDDGINEPNFAHRRRRRRRRDRERDLGCLFALPARTSNQVMGREKVPKNSFETSTPLLLYMHNVYIYIAPRCGTTHVLNQPTPRSSIPGRCGPRCVQDMH